MSYTRKQYMENECTHRQYYGQFVTPGVKRSVLSVFGIETLLASEDEHLNDIALARWDRLSNAIKPTEPGTDGKKYYSLCAGVCILKEAARQLIEEAVVQS